MIEKGSLLQEATAEMYVLLDMRDLIKPGLHFRTASGGTTESIENALILSKAEAIKQSGNIAGILTIAAPVSSFIEQGKLARRIGRKAIMQMDQ